MTADDPSRATTTLAVELDGTTARITELVVRAGDGDGLTPGQIPAVDLDLLLKAVTPAVGGQEAITVSPAAAADEETAPEGESGAVAEPGGTEAAQPVATTTSTATEPATASPGNSDATEVAVPKQASRAKAQAAGATRAGGRRAVPGAKATGAARKTTKQTGKGETSKDKGRAYRRSPGDLESVYQQAGSVAAVADHYNVPRHTAQGWIRTLRRRQANSPE
ncbi:hypothetical protein C1I99_15935 [Micromonospora deserti]|uniref:Helix-turn-helix domain-containing protein n=1 Tax=Micromonospora deserti TaxID=2070366 RepID=A0A2W2CCQ5_9ACTN|nr:hypothetical protein C1I99_15935 [Micromonospora deserti]